MGWSGVRTGYGPGHLSIQPRPVCLTYGSGAAVVTGRCYHATRFHARQGQAPGPKGKGEAKSLGPGPQRYAKHPPVKSPVWPVPPGGG